MYTRVVSGTMMDESNPYFGQEIEQFNDDDDDNYKNDDGWKHSVF